MKFAFIILALALTGCSGRVHLSTSASEPGEPDGTSQTMKIADVPLGSGVFVIRDYEHGQLCTFVKASSNVSLQCQAWELPPP